MIDEKTQEELDYLYALGATDSVLKDLALDDDHDTFVVCPQPFSALADSSAQAVSVPVEFGGTTVTFSLRKTLSDGSWWITEEGNESTIQRFVLDTYKHRYGSFEYIIVSPYSYSEDLSDALKRQCIANCSLLIKY